MSNGVVEQGGKQRTRSKALAFLVEKVKSYDGAIENLAVLHADCSDVDVFVDMLRPYAPEEIVVGEIGPVIGTHGGRGTIGVAFQVTAKFARPIRFARPHRESPRGDRGRPSVRVVVPLRESAVVSSIHCPARRPLSR